MYISSEAIGAIATVCVVIGLPLSIGYVRKMGRTNSPMSLPAADIVARLERMEQGIEAIATEVERIAEGQRFTTKLLKSDIDSADRGVR